MPHAEARRCAYALLHKDHAGAAVAALRGSSAQAAVEGLVELIHRATGGRETIAAIEALADCDSPLVLPALRSALEVAHALVRLAAVQSLHRRRSPCTSAFARLLRRDSSWPVRRAALEALADLLDPDRWQVLHAATDPHWRVRHALIRVLLSWGPTPEVLHRLEQMKDIRSDGVRAYLLWRWEGRLPEGDSASPDPAARCPFWDWDAAVLARHLEQMGDEGRRQALAVMPFLLGHTDERVRTWASKTLVADGDSGHLAEALTLLDEPRNGAGETVHEVVDWLDLDRAEALVEFVLYVSDRSPAQLVWTLDQAERVYPPEEEESTLLDLFFQSSHFLVPVRCALARLAGRWPHAESVNVLLDLLHDEDAEVQAEALRGWRCPQGELLPEELLNRLLRSNDATVRAEAVATVFAEGADRSRLEPLLTDPEPGVRVRLAECIVNGKDEQWSEWLARLQGDMHPHVRAAALTPERAGELMREPMQETSWHVLAKAARMLRKPLWKLAPNPRWKPPAEVPLPAEPLCPRQPGPPHARLLGPQRLAVAPLGISGHYGLPVEGFVRAVDAGVNLLFWEPNYRTLTEFFARLPASQRQALHILAGTFEADGKRVRRDAERVLRTLGIEQVAFFFLFWVQSCDRITPDVRQSLERLKVEGKIGAFGLSTHARTLAVEAMETGWNPVMVRHSGAHRGAEEQVFPRAAELGVDVITFSNTCYGRLLQPQGDLPAPHPADCYRYTLERPAVRACFAAPATLDQLDQNLEALRDPSLPDERRRRLQESGAVLYREETVFRKLVRSR